MLHRPLDHSLKTEGLLEHIFIPFRDTLHMLFEKVFKAIFNIPDIAPAVFNNLRTFTVMQDCKKNMFDTNVFMVPSFGFINRKTECCAKFFADHAPNPFPWNI